jgi:hypothetical protein
MRYDSLYRVEKGESKVSIVLKKDFGKQGFIRNEYKNRSKVIV